MKRKLIAVLSLAFASATQAGTVFINELHYDNAGGDVGEFIEVAAPSGTDLSAWSVVLYNGSNGTSYNTLNLSGIVSDAGQGYGFTLIELPANGLQNGSPDGLALVDANGNVVEFLSYEGTMLASNGPAAGITSTDIGVSEPSNTPIGFSLQLAGSGAVATDFTWQEASLDTRGAINTGQSFGEQVDIAPTVVITPADGASNVPVDANITLQFSEDVVISGVNAVECLSEVSINTTLSGEGAFYTLNPDQDFLSADQCRFTLNANDVTDLDGAPDNLAEDITVNFSVIDTSATIEFVINEIHADPANDAPGDANGDGQRDFSEDEFVELVNIGNTDADISGWSLSDGATLRHTFPEGSVVEAGCAVVVFGGGAPTDVFGGALVQTASSGAVGLNNGGDTVTLSNGVLSVQVEYGNSEASDGGNNQSITRSPDISGDFEQHTLADTTSNALYSPGTQLDGTLFSGCSIPDLAPSVVDISPSDGATNVIVDTTISITFSEPVSVSALPTLSCSVSGDVALLGELSVNELTLTPAQALASEEVCTVNVPAGTITDLDGSVDTMLSDFSSSFTTISNLVCGTSDVTMISSIQGTGFDSPLVGQDLLIQGVVTALVPNRNAFFVQEEEADYDADPSTSEGLYINNETGFTAPNVGEVVLLSGTIAEFFERTQMTLLAEPVLCGETAQVTSTSFSLPVSSNAELEALEGMLVSNAAPLTITNNFGLGRFGELVLSDGRLFNPNNVTLPGSAENAALVAQNALNSIVLDDGSNQQNPEFVPFPTGGLSASNSARLGDTLSSLRGVVDFSFGNYSIYATEEPTFVSTNARSNSPDLAQGNLTVASLNVLNFFSTIDTGAANCGPASDSNCRGADDNGVDGAGRTEFERQALKTVAAIAAMDADIVGLMEIENNGFGDASAIQTLVNLVNAEVGEGTYAAVEADGPVGTDAIVVAFMYKPAVVSLSGDLHILDSSNSIMDEFGPLFDDNRNRPSLIQTFALLENGEEIVISVNHLKSKGSSCGPGDDDALTGQGNCNLTRTRAAQALTAYLAENFAGMPSMIIGDLNAYALEDPIQAITSQGYTDLANLFGGDEAYSFSFGGELGYLDHALANDVLLDSVVDTTEWHINADEPRVLDYNFEFQSASQIDDWFAPDPYRMSDHDPILVSLLLETESVFGDFDGDGDIDVSDLKIAFSAIFGSEDVGLEFDINGDGILNVADVRALIALCTRERCAR